MVGRAGSADLLIAASHSMKERIFIMMYIIVYRIIFMLDCPK